MSQKQYTTEFLPSLTVTKRSKHLAVLRMSLVDGLLAMDSPTYRVTPEEVKPLPFKAFNPVSRYDMSQLFKQVGLLPLSLHIYATWIRFTY